MAPSFEQLRGLRILVAEDETLVLLEIEDMLREFGCEIVGPVSTVADAVAAIRQNDLDGALLDMNLRGERVAPAAEELLAPGSAIHSLYRLCQRGQRRTGAQGCAKAK